jgi:hypothetical protein
MSPHTIFLDLPLLSNNIKQYKVPQYVVLYIPLLLKFYCSFITKRR